LKQPQYKPYDEVAEILSIFATTQGLFDDIEVENLMTVENQMIEYIKNIHPEITKKLYTGAKIDDALRDELKNKISEFKKKNNYGSESTGN
jgi:F-type H+-transporting ATPase subunit alpha